MPIVHTFVSAINDPAAELAGKVSGNRWNEEHDLSGLVAADITDLGSAATADAADFATAAQGTKADSAVQPTATTTLTNKRITARVGSTTSSATPTINTDNVDIYRLTAQAADITSFTSNLSGTPSHGDALIIEITGTAPRAITWGTGFEASTVALPTTTVGTDMLSVAFLFNSASSKWRCMGAV